MRWGIIFCLFLMMACAVKPPVQEMAEARSAIANAKQTEQVNQKLLNEAETIMNKASNAIENKEFERARGLAKMAKSRAQKSTQTE